MGDSIEGPDLKDRILETRMMLNFIECNGQVVPQAIWNALLANQQAIMLVLQEEIDRRRAGHD